MRQDRGGVVFRRQGVAAASRDADAAADVQRLERESFLRE